MRKGTENKTSKPPCSWCGDPVHPRAKIGLCRACAEQKNIADTRDRLNKRLAEQKANRPTMPCSCGCGRPATYSPRTSYATAECIRVSRQKVVKPPGQPKRFPKRKTSGGRENRAKAAAPTPVPDLSLMRFDGRRTLFDPISKRTTADDCPKRAKAVDEAERRVRR